MKRTRLGYTYSGYYRNVGSFVFLFENRIRTFVEVTINRSVFKYMTLK